MSVEHTGRGCDQSGVASSSSAINIQNECYTNSFKQIKILKNAANENEENFSGLKSTLPIKINGSYLGSNEKINQINCLDQSIKERRRSLRERTPIKISGTQFIREMGDIENDPSSDSISVIAPFGQIFSEGRNPAQPFSNKMRFIPTKKSSQDFIENYPENKSLTSKARESGFENVIHSMKNTLKSLKTNVSFKTLKEINREVTPFDLPDLDPVSEGVDQNRSLAISSIKIDIDSQVPSLKPLINGEGKPDTIATHPNIDIDLQEIQSESHTADDMNGSQAKYSFGGRLRKSGRKTKKKSFKNTISYLLSKALDDSSDSDSESNSDTFSSKSSISPSVKKSLSVTSGTSAGDEETCISDPTFEDDLENVLTSERTSVTDCLDTESYSWYFDLEKNGKKKKHLEGNRYEVPTENQLKMTSHDLFCSKIKLEENYEKPLPAPSSRNTEARENEMRLDVMGFNKILQRSVCELDRNDG